MTPVQSMWPLVCSEVGLSYEQEEKIRGFQKTTLQDQETWLDRHTSFATGKVLESAHDAGQALALRFGQRERTGLGVLSDDQKFKFLSWAEKNRERIKSISSRLPGPPSHANDKYQTSESQHVAANLYVLNDRLQKVLQKVPPASPLVAGNALKKLSRRPSFESLGCADKFEGPGLSRENSFASSGSLKRAASEMSMDGSDDQGEKSQVPQITPSEAQSTAAALVESVLGRFKEIIPAPPTPSVVSTRSIPIPSPTPVLSTEHQNQPKNYHAFQPLQPVPASSAGHGQAPPPYAQLASSVPSHSRSASYLPPTLNVVPEEIWPVDGSAEDLLMSLVDDDWAIGEGVDMELDPSY